MIRNFRKVVDGLYRGSGPSPQDVVQLKKHFGINKIISLDEGAGQKIDRICKLLHIKHIMLPIDAKNLRVGLLNLLKHNLKDLLLKDGPTYVHCIHGKDRTGLVIALFKCKYMGMSPEQAIKEAKSFGFGIGLDPKITNLYEKLIKQCHPEGDINKADIVSNEREYKSDNRDTFLDEARPGSFAPYLSKTRQMPMDALYVYVNDQSPTRENYQTDWADKKKELKNEEEGSEVPLVGVFDNDAGARGFGPVEPNPGGFIYD